MNSLCPTESAGASSPHDRTARNITSSSSSFSGGSLLHCPTGYTREKWRVGAPPLLYLPLMNADAFPEEAEFSWFFDIQAKAKAFLREQDVEFDFVRLVSRRPRGPRCFEVDPTNLTLLVEAEWEENKNPADVWLRCVDFMRGLLFQCGQGEVSVEMLSWERYHEKYICPVEAGNAFVEAWNRHIHDDVITIIERDLSLRKYWRSVDTLRFGYVDDEWSDRSRNPVVVSVTVDYACSHEHWAIPEQEIRKLLDDTGFSNVGIEIEHGDVKLFNPEFETLPDTHLRGISPDMYPLRPGLSISGIEPLRDAAGEIKVPSMGTIGLIVELYNPSTGTHIMDCILTSYHTIRPWIPGWQYPTKIEERQGYLPPISGSLCQKIDQEGFSLVGRKFGPLLGDAYSRMGFQSPSDRLFEYSLAERKESVKSLEDALETLEYSPNERKSATRRLKNMKADVIKLETNHDHYVGKPVVASGFRRQGRVRLDYALIAIEDDSKTRNNSLNLRDWGLITPTMDRITGAGNLGDYTPGKTRLFKRGAQTGCTLGVHGGAKSSVKFPWDAGYTTDFACYSATDILLSIGSGFACHGDSGSAIFSQEGRWLGLVVGGVTKQLGEAPIVYFSPAAGIIEDIKTRTGLDVRIKGLTHHAFECLDA